MLDRDTARKAGLTRYDPGKPCKHGHASYRQVSDNQCCQCVSVRKATYYRGNKSSIDQRISEYRARNYEAHLKRCADYRVSHRDRVIVSNYLYRLGTSRKAYQAQWFKDNSDRVRINRANRRARIRSTPGKLSRNLIDKLMVSQWGMCACCGKSLSEGYHLDHRIPLALGGPNEDSNMQLLTPICNKMKGAKHPEEYKFYRLTIGLVSAVKLIPPRNAGDFIPDP